MRDTGFKDKRGEPIYEGDLVITRERGWRWRAADVWFQRRGLGSITWPWFGRLGRSNGKVWLGIVEEWFNDDNPKTNPPRWQFRSINQGATIHDYWACDLEIVKMPPKKPQKGHPCYD
jgi:hypothetical protein